MSNMHERQRKSAWPRKNNPERDWLCKDKKGETDRCATHEAPTTLQQPESKHDRSQLC